MVDLSKEKRRTKAGDVQPSASIILCVRNGGAQLHTCLQHLGAQRTRNSIEIILVDNGSTDDTAIVMEEFATSSAHPTVLLECLEKGNGAGRNMAINHASADLLLFIDGDCYAAEDFAESWLAIFSEHNLGYGSGRIRRFNHSHSMLGCNESTNEVIIPPQAFVPRGFVQGSNMAFTRACLEQIGGLDRRFGAGTPYAGEEWEMVLRASFAGYSGGYFPTPTVWHDHGRFDDVARERALYYDFGAGAVYAKHFFSQHLRSVARTILREIIYEKDTERRLMIMKGFLNWFTARENRIR